MDDVANSKVALGNKQCRIFNNMCEMKLTVC